MVLNVIDPSYIWHICNLHGSFIYYFLNLPGSFIYYFPNVLGLKPFKCFDAFCFVSGM